MTIYYQLSINNIKILKLRLKITQIITKIFLYFTEFIIWVLWKQI